MASAAKLKQSSPVRMLLMGYPGAGKTGSLVSLINAGFKLRVLDFDGNFRPITLFSDEKRLENVDILPLYDRRKLGAEVIEPAGTPTAYASACKALMKWTYKDGDVDVDLGASREWGPDTVVVIDSLTSMGEACMARALHMANRTSRSTRDADWGVAIAFQRNFLQLLLDPSNRFHVICLAHLKLIGPKETRKGDDDTTIKIKEQLADEIPVRLYPSALGRGFPTEVAGLFDTALLVERKIVGGKSKRVITTNVGREIDVKIPSLKLDKELPIEDGLIQIFKALVPWAIPA
jgi:hypothetical protein